MIQLTRLDDKITLTSVPPERIVRMEVIVEKRGGHIHLTDGRPTSLGTRLFLDGQPEPLDVIEHLFEIQDLIEPDSLAAREREAERIAQAGREHKERAALARLATGAPVYPGDKLP